jgi:hypothetical protein
MTDMPTQPRRRWFQLTTLELVVIVVIALILIGLLVPAFQHSENTPRPRPPAPATHDPTVAIEQEAVAEVTRRTGIQPNYLEAKVKRNGEGYTVLVWRLPVTPGGHYLLKFSNDGTLKEFERGK